MNESAQTIASNMTFVTVSLLATTLVVLVPTWKRFRDSWNHVTAESKQAILKGSAIPIAIPLGLLVGASISVTIFPRTWDLQLPSVILLVFAALTIPVYLYVIPRAIWKKVTATNWGPKPKPPNVSKEIAATSALACFLIAIVMALIIVMLAIPLAINVQLGGNPQPDNFEAARALTVVLPLTLACGLGWLGMSYGLEFSESTSGSAPG